MKAFALALLVGSATAASNNTNWESVKISVNQTAINDFYNDALRFHRQWSVATKNERSNIVNALGDAYKNTAGKAILNFGSTVVPAVRSWATLAGQVKTNPTCN